MLVWQDSPVWRLQINLNLRGMGNVASLGTVDVDAVTREVLPLSAEKIEVIQKRADAIAFRLSPTAATAV